MPTILDQGSWCTRPQDPAGYVAALIAELADPASILDATFEAYGNFITPDPISYRTRQPLYPSGTVLFWGNFLSHAGVFRLSTDDPDIIARLTAAIRNHQQTERYQGQWFCRLHHAGYHFLHGSWHDPQGNLLSHEQESRLHRPDALPLTTVTAPTFPTHPAAQLPLF